MKTTIKLTEVPRELYPSHSWLHSGDNRDALRVWLKKHNVNIAAVFNIQFRNDGFTISQYLLDEGGHKQTESNEVLTEVIEHEYLPGMKPRLLYEGRPRSS